MKFLFALCLLSSVAWGAEEQSMPQAKAPDWVKYTIPGEAHKQLDKAVGHFNYKMKTWKDAKAKPEETTGYSDNTWLLDGRYLRQELKGTAMGQAFNGIGITGYDNYSGQFQSIWMDDMSTAIMWMAGENKPDAKVIKISGSGSNPYKEDKNFRMRSELKILGKNEHTYTSYCQGQDQKEFKCMEIRYKRAK
jgi:hypothetical protein